jgi:hypothetical protein
MGTPQAASALITYGKTIPALSLTYIEYAKSPIINLNTTKLYLADIANM